MIQQRNSFLWFKLNGLIRYCLAHSSTRLLNLVVVNEFPKSGGSWVADMLSDALEIPFPRNRLPMLRSCILHGHMMHSWNMSNVLVVWRDGRDVLVSQYYHSLFENDRGNTRLVGLTRSDLGFRDYNDIKTNLVPFMEYVFEERRHPAFSWVQFVNKWSGRADCCQVKYEDLRERPAAELQRMAWQLAGKQLSDSKAGEIAEKHSFARLAGRPAGQQNTSSFLRKGVVGDWKNHFSKDARERFNRYAGDALIKLGYESGGSWV